MLRNIRIMLVVMLTFFGVAAAMVDPAQAHSGTGVCQVPGKLKVTGTGTNSDPCKYNIPHSKYYEDWKNTNLQGDAHFARYYTSERYSLVFGIRNGVANKRSKGVLLWNGENTEQFYGQITFVGCLTPNGTAISCGYLHITIIEHDVGKDYQEKLICGTAYDAGCQYPNYRHFMAWGGIHHVGGDVTTDHECWRQHVHISWASAWIHNHYVSSKGRKPLATAVWKGCDSA